MAKKKQSRRRPARQKAAKRGVDRRLASGMANSLRTQIMVALNERVASATELARELGVDYDKVRYEIRALEQSGAIRLKTERASRNVIEKFYEATTEPWIDESEWPSVPDSLKGAMRGSLFQVVVDEVVDALSEGTYDSREGAHMSWVPMILDEKGWGEIVEILAEALDRVVDVRDRCADDLRTQDEPGISAVVSMMGFISVGGERKVGPPPA